MQNNKDCPNDKDLLYSTGNYMQCLVFFEYIFIFIYLAALGLSGDMWDPVSWPGIEPRPPALGVQSLTHWSTREILKVDIFYIDIEWVNHNPKRELLQFTNVETETQAR